VDHDRAADILSHLMVGSEGTFGFVADMTFRTVPSRPRARPRSSSSPSSRRRGRRWRPSPREGGCPRDPRRRFPALDLDRAPAAFDIDRRHAALLVELRREDEARLAAAVDEARAILGHYRLLEAPRFTTGEEERTALWHLRKGLAARTGAMRPTGTAFLTEDVAVPVARLAEAILDFQALFEGHGIPDTVIFGHAKDGNLHFVMAEDVRSPEAIERYGAFMHGLVDLVVNKYDGAIKASTGRGATWRPSSGPSGGPCVLRDGAGQADARPRRHPEPGCRAEPQPARAPREPQALPDHLPPRRPLHRVRLLRAALPLARPHAHAPPAHRRDARADAAARLDGTRGPGVGEALEADFAYQG